MLLLVVLQEHALHQGRLRCRVAYIYAFRHWLRQPSFLPFLHDASACILTVCLFRFAQWGHACFSF
jgi:hypothetical protein